MVSRSLLVFEGLRFDRFFFSRSMESFSLAILSFLASMCSSQVPWVQESRGAPLWEKPLERVRWEEGFLKMKDKILKI